LLISTRSVSSADWESYQRLLFLEGEEDYEEIGLDNERELFIDDVLETAQWYTILNTLLYIPLSPSPAYSDLSIQGCHPRITE